MGRIRGADEKGVVDIEAQAARLEVASPKTSKVLDGAVKGLAMAGDSLYATGPKVATQYVLGGTRSLGETTEWGNLFSRPMLRLKDNPFTRSAEFVFQAMASGLDVLTLHALHDVAQKFGTSEYAHYLNPRPSTLSG